MDVASAAHVPLPAVPLLGRDEELARLCADFGPDGRSKRLITLVGPPGVGKTLLAQHAAVKLSAKFTSGVVFVALDSIGDAELVPSRLAQSLGLREQAGRTLNDTLIDYLHDKHVLLVLDNFEHVLGAASVVAGILAGCPEVAVLVTSRTPLRLAWETLQPLEPLAAVPAVELFLARVRAVRPSIVVSTETANAIATICTRLDGLPLAIELAASRANVLSPQEIAERLSHRFVFLTSGGGEAPARHQALRRGIRRVDRPTRLDVEKL